MAPWLLCAACATLSAGSPPAHARSGCPGHPTAIAASFVAAGPVCATCHTRGRSFGEARTPGSAQK